MYRRRAGFTLIELIVVITIIIILAGLALAFLPTATDRQRATQGAGMLQGWLLIAKQRALRDQAPRGLRLVIDPANPTIVTQCQYIEQPDPMSGGQAMTNPAANTVTFTGVDLTGGFVNPGDQLVQPGDFFETPINSGLPYHQISTVGPQTITVLANAANPLPPATLPSGTSSYQIVRAPRVATGDPTLNLPKDIAIDVGAGRSIITADARGFFDIVFSPAGPVMGRGLTNGRIILWVRDVSLDPSQPGEQTLITVYSRTGLIAAHPAVLAGPNPYLYTQDGRASGL
jgi:prepilin-type N-terminal cleavage/methylation domain-containing protein